MSLKSAKKITRRNRDVIPMPDTVIAQVNYLGRNQPEQLMFMDKKGRHIGNVKLTRVDKGATSQAPQDL